MYCYNCGEENPDEAKFCKNCGTLLKKEETVKKVEVIEVPNNQSYNQQKTTTTSSSSNTGSSSWIGCCCLALVVIFIIFALLGRH
jgi:uncharacterized membrane protein YvbJ